jgi:hypothetical protein
MPVSGFSPLGLLHSSVALALACTAAGCVAASDPDGATSAAQSQSAPDPQLESCAAVVAEEVYSVDQGMALPEVEQQLSAIGAQLIAGTTVDASWTNGFQAMTVLCADGALMIGYRGTQAPADAVVDLGVINAMATPTGGLAIRLQVERARGEKTWANWAGTLLDTGSFASALAGRLVSALDYYDKIVAQYGKGRRIVVAGHSLGGFLASYVAYSYGEAAFTFNSAPGAKYVLFRSASEIDPTLANAIVNDRMIGDPVSGAPFTLDSQGFPYGHLGQVSNWIPTKSYGIPDIHFMQTFFDHGFTNTQLTTEYAPTSSFFW